MELGGVGNMPERFFPEVPGTAVKVSRVFKASRGLGMSTDADLPLRAIPRAETVGGAMMCCPVVGVRVNVLNAD